jgi:hypothetical protein
MEAILRPHRGGTVLALGILSLGCALAGVGLASQGFLSDPVCTLVSLAALPIGILAFVLGWRQIAGMKASRIDPAGRRKTRAGQDLAVAAMCLAVPLATCIILFYPRDHMEVYGDGTVAVTKMYSGSVPKTQYHEVLLPDGRSVKTGPFLLWSRSGKKLEEGSYSNDKRDGPWTFWNEDGSIDTTRSGFYENDVRVDGRVPSPAGDYTPPPGGNQPRR